jgi:hypothetical protein
LKDGVKTAIIVKENIRGVNVCGLFGLRLI